MRYGFIHFLSGIIILFACTAPSSFQKEKTGIIVSVRSDQVKSVKLEVIDDDIIRVTASPTGTFAEEINLIKDVGERPVPSFDARQTGDTVLLETSSIRAFVLQTTGEVWFADKAGNVILREKQGGGKTYEPVEVEGMKGYALHQVFEGRDGEGLYGLGQHQSDEFNYKGKNEELFQYNTKVSIPFIISTEGYGILWHNYSLSRFGDKRPYSDLDQVFKLYNKEGKENTLTATYYRDRAGEDMLQTREESVINYEDLVTVKNFPEKFLSGEASAVWEGELEPAESGKYHFRLHYAGYTKVYINNEEVVPERWRTAWNPNVYKIALTMEKGMRYPLRIEWKPDGGVSYLGLKVLSPVSEAGQNRIAFFSEMGDEIDYYFINGKTMDEVIGGYRTVTGKSRIMPKWAMGYWLSRERYKTQNELLEALDEYRKRQVPLDVIVQDWSYWPVDAWGSHEFDKERYPDPRGMIEQVHRLNARFMLSVWPKFYITTAHYKELDAIGAMYQQAVKDSIRDWIYPGYIGSFYDAYNPEAQQLFWNQMNEHLYSLGVDAWWMDASEPNVQDNTDMDYRKSLCGPTRLGPSAKYFNAYSLENAKAIYNGQRNVNPDSRVFLLTRSGFAGLQRYAAATWSGDIATRWEDMKAQISAGLNFAMSGIPYWTMDIGGFCVEKRYEKASEGSEDRNEWRELNTRWFQFGAFCPLFRTHGQYPCREIYHISPEGSPAYRSMKYYTELRYRLMPYIYSLAGMTWFNDYTIMRALVMDDADDRNTYHVDDQFMFGPAFMVCPVYRYKARTREVYFPEGRWYDYYTGKVQQGGINKTVDAPCERIPLYVKGGSIIPAGQLIQSTSETQANLTVYVYAGKDGAFTLYEDDGTTYNYEKGAYSMIAFRYSEADKKLTIEKRRGAYNGMAAERNISVIFITPENAEGKQTDLVYAGEPVEIELAE
ncbi:MAG: DUF5110 domain-containing protein [Tannerella sp.]|jgi:alpha-D-xyloside xylohydrolase|nr:DUF5110 domain-containing protein [Tannerella sp.]